MEKWREEFKDAPAPEVEITFHISRRFYAIDADNPHGGAFTNIDMPFVLDSDSSRNIAYMPSKDAARHKESFLKFCRRAIELEKDINKSTDGTGPNLWYGISVTDAGKSVCALQTVCPYTINHKSFPSLSRMADLSQTGLLDRYERHTRDDDEVSLTFATDDHVFLVEHEYGRPDQIYKSIRINRPVFSKSYNEAVFRAGTIMEYIRASLRI